MNFFGKKPGRFGNEDDFYKIPLEDEDEALEEIDSQESAPAPVADSGVGIGGSSIELKVVRPEALADAVVIADHLLSGRTVVLNMEAVSKDVSLRLRDFLNGVAHAIGGQIRCVANTTYIATPNNVDVTETALRGDRAEDEE